MTYFNGFCLHGEEKIVKPYVVESDYTVAGFSYGAQKAFEYALTCKERIDTLQLFSPAFFNEKEESFKKLQTLAFAKDSDAYCEAFLKNCTSPSNLDLKPFFKKGSKEELEALLNYKWDIQKLERIADKDILIEVYLGECDAIIDALTCKDFFLPYATVYYFKDVGHCLC